VSLSAATAESCNDASESALRSEFTFTGALRNRFVEKFIAVLRDCLCPLRFTSVADIAPGRDRSALRNQRSSSAPVRVDPAQQFPIEKSLRERRRAFTAKYFLLLCLLCAMLLKIFYR
jgi:hypothetical protein